MSNLAYRTEPKRIKQQKTNVSVNEQQQNKLFRITPGEKLIVLVLSVGLMIGCIAVISSQASIFKANEDLQLLQKQIDEQQKVNSGLEGQVLELRNPERILQIANEQGLTINENNVQLIQQR